MDFYKNIIRKILFEFDPEFIHHLSVDGLKSISDLGLSNKFCYQKKFEKTKMGLKFPNPIGLAAGFDKNAKLLDSIHLLGFGFMEVGTITPKPQEGNPKPRIYRFPEDKSLINSMGFNNDGLMIINRRLEKRNPSNIIIGANIGKNKSTEINFAFRDYVMCIKELYSNIDYFTLNISSPNTTDLRTLSKTDSLKHLLDSVQNQNQKNTISRPIVLKISPDMTDDEIFVIVDVCQEYGISGIISTNTTTNHNYEKGGLSGNPLNNRSREVLKLLKDYNNQNICLISSGGVMSTEISNERFDIGADLIQIYTGLIYEGPFFVSKILEKYNS